MDLGHKRQEVYLCACVLLRPNLISGGPRNNVIIADLVEAEYGSLAQAAAEILRIQTLLSELCNPCSVPHIYCDKLSSVAFSHNPVLHGRTKYIHVLVSSHQGSFSLQIHSFAIQAKWVIYLKFPMAHALLELEGGVFFCFLTFVLVAALYSFSFYMLTNSIISLAYSILEHFDL